MLLRRLPLPGARVRREVAGSVPPQRRRGGIRLVERRRQLDLARPQQRANRVPGAGCGGVITAAAAAGGEGGGRSQGRGGGGEGDGAPRREDAAHARRLRGRASQVGGALREQTGELMAERASTRRARRISRLARRRVVRTAHRLVRILQPCAVGLVGGCWPHRGSLAATDALCLRLCRAVAEGEGSARWLRWLVLRAGTAGWYCWIR